MEMPIYGGRSELNSATNMWFKGLNIELKTFRLIAWTTFQESNKISKAETYSKNIEKLCLGYF